MTREQAINYLKSSGMSEEQIETVINAFTCEDCISREEAIEWMENIRSLNRYYHPKENDDETLVSEVISRLKQVPSVTPKILEPCEDCISRAEVRKVLSNEVFELMKLHAVNPEDNPKADAMAHGVNWSLNTLMDLPSVTPKFTDAEIQKMQELEQAQLEKAYELGKAEVQLCDDCISRTEALKHSHIEYDDDGIGHRVVYVEDIEELPSVTPKASKD